MERDKSDELLRHAAKRAAEHPFFLAVDLEDFRLKRQMQEADLAQFLGCPPELLPKMRLCRRPDPESPQFRADVQRISEAFSTEPARLAQLIRETAALRAMHGAGRLADQETGRGLLMAARDAEPGESPGQLGPDGPHRKPEKEG